MDDESEILIKDNELANSIKNLTYVISLTGLAITLELTAILICLI